MTLREDITAACPPDVLASGDWEQIAAAVSKGRTRIVSRQIGIGTVLATVPNGGKFLDALVGLGGQNRDVFWAMELVKAGTFDIGMDASRKQMAALAEAIPPMAKGIEALLALAVEPAPVTAAQVQEALRDPDAWQEQFTPRRPGETVGTMTVTRRGFSFTSTLNKDRPETVDAYWAECLKAEAVNGK